MNYVSRDIEHEALQFITGYPVLTITGPRQSGKTTLAKYLFPSLPYYNFENPDTRRFATLDPRAFLFDLKAGAILDEIQNVPDLISYLQQIVDENRKSSCFILTGSNHFSLMDRVSQSLAGRTAILKLLPFSINELKHTLEVNTDKILLKGFYPEAIVGKIEPTKIYQNYYETYLQKDLRQLIQVKDLNLFDKFIRLCAGRIGNVLNTSNLANEPGLSVPTIRHWLSVMEASFILMLLPSFHDNINKRLIKSPKLYFYDTGLASYLLGIESSGQMERDPLKGALFENMVVMEIVKQRFNSGMTPSLSFFRDSHHVEIDLVFTKGNQIIPIEIKSSKTFHPDFLKGLDYIEKLFPAKIPKSFLVYDGLMEQS